MSAAPTHMRTRHPPWGQQGRQGPGGGAWSPRLSLHLRHHAWQRLRSCTPSEPSFCQTITAVWCYQACSRPTTDRYSVLKDHLLSMYKNLSYVIFPVLRLDCSTLCALPIKADLDRHHTVKSEQDNPDRGLMSDCSIQWYVLYMWPEATYTPGISRVE